MRNLLLLIGGFLAFNLSVAGNNVNANPSESNFVIAENVQQNDTTHDLQEHSGGEHTEEGDHGGGHGHGAAPAAWSVIPFILLLAMIATGPLFYAHFWHKYYPLVAFFLGTITVIYYLFFLHDTVHPLHALGEYLSFIALVGSLFVASGGILIKVDKEGTPAVNVGLLIIGAILANVIGTTGASMLLIRPFIRVNKNRIKPYHVVFFIFMVSNMGGSLTPIGDPPLFLGFLKGIPFFWTMEHLWPQWLFGIGLMSIIFYFVDKRNHSNYSGEETPEYSGKISIKGLHSSIWLVVVIIAVFLDPNIFDWVPPLVIDGVKISVLREIIMIGASIAAYKTASKECLRGNEFDFEPIKEVGYLFVGIFATMMPALQLISGYASSPSGEQLISAHTLYWATGMLSGVLDNAPTYLNFLAAGMGKVHLSIDQSQEVLQFSAQFLEMLAAISIGAVFFGAFTYIGNAPNFMVKSIAEQVGIKMPSFMGYIVRYSIPILLPVLALTWLVFHVLELFNFMF